MWEKSCKLKYFVVFHSSFEKAKNWLELLHSKNQEIEIYNKLVFNELLGEFWAKLLSKNIENAVSKKAFYSSSLSSFINSTKKSNLTKAFKLRSFPFNSTVKPVWKRWKEWRNRKK